MDERQERDLKAALLVTRIVAFAMCYAAPALYAVVYGLVSLEGRWELFLQGLGAVPWHNPLVLGLLAIAATTLAVAFVLPGLLAQRQQGLPGLAALRARSIVAFALVEAVAIHGLMLGFLLGPSVASLVLALLLVPPACCPLLLASEEQWRQRLDPRDHA